MSRFLNEKYKKLQAYTPGEQPRDMKYIKLNTNESPFPPSQGVIDAVNKSETQKLRLYSDPECTALKKAVSELYGVGTENVYLSNGSDDILNFSFMAFAGSKVKAAFPEISYGFYKVYAELYGIDYVKIPLKEDFSICADDYCNLNSFIVIANPNAPTGKTISTDDIIRILETNPDNVVLIDEAYVDFGGESVYPLTEKYKNLLVVQTFSKSRSLAGARLGFAIGDSELIADLNKIKYSTNPYNINRLSLVAGEAAIKDNEYYMENCRKIMENRDYTVKELSSLGFYTVPSKANFIFTRSDKISGESLYQKLKKKGILVRHFSDEKISDFVRVTIGDEFEMKQFIETVKDILEEENENG